MLSIIVILTFLSLTILVIGFLGVRLPFLSMPITSPATKLSKHTRKLLRKRSWYNQTHKGFVKLTT